MLKKLLILSMMLILASSLVTAQSRAVLKANGDLIKLKDSRNMKEAIKVTKFTNLSGQAVQKNVFLDGSLDAQGTIDTLAYSDMATFNTNFGMFDGNVMMQYFKAPADLVINAAGFTVSDDVGAANSTISLRLLKLNWTWEELTSVPAPLNMGVYPEAGDGLGGIDPFGENATGNWEDSTGGAYSLPPWADNVDPAANTWNYDLWSDGGFGWPVTAVASEFTAKVYQWVDMSGLFIPDTIKQGEVFAVALTHDGSDPNFPDEDRIGFWSDNSIGIPGWKYYEEGRSFPQDGWYARKYTWDFVVGVELVGDRAPSISGVTRLLTTVDTGPQTVQAMIVDDNPSGGNAGVASAELMYSLDTGKTYQSVAMADQGGDIFAADIPGQSPGTLITYKVMATDVEGGVTETGTNSYSIFKTVNKQLLVIFNGGTEGRALQLAGFYVQGLVENYDVWAAYGPVGDFISFYDAVLEIHSENGPDDNNQAALTAYAAAGGKVLGVVGQETLGYLNGFTDSTFVAGDYEYDVLGVMNGYNDVNYAASGDEQLPSPVFAVAGTAYGDAMAQWLTGNALDTAWYFPYDILGSDNWMDQFDPRGDVGSEVFMNGASLDGTVRPVGHSFTQANGTEIFFMSADPLSFEADSGWVGGSTLSPLPQFLADKVVSVRQTDNDVPNRFELTQNYPNPFNPTTNINFSIPKSGLTSLTVYNILGQKVATLLNKELAAGSYTVDFNAANLSSGMYIYSVKTGDVELTKKMMLLK